MKAQLMYFLNKHKLQGRKGIERQTEKKIRHVNLQYFTWTKVCGQAVPTVHRSVSVCSGPVKVPLN